MEKKLSLSQLEILSTIIPESFDQEYNRNIVDLRKNDIKAFFLGFYFESKFFTFSAPKTLIHFSTEIASNPIIRDFILNLTDRCLVLMSVEEMDFDSCCETLAAGLCTNKPPQTEAKYILLPDQVAQSLEVSTEELKRMFKNNAWLLVLYYLHLFMHKTTFFQEVK